MPPKRTNITPAAAGPPITTVGVRRPGYGKFGTKTQVLTNHFVAQIPRDTIHHYDAILPESKILPARVNMEIITTMQKTEAAIFTPKVVYDGRKNIFAPQQLNFGGPDSKEFEVFLNGTEPRADGKPPKSHKVRLTKVAEINPETLHRYLEGKQSHDNSVLTAITALNVVIRMEPTIKWPFNVRSFFTNLETKNIGGGLVAWRGYFQSARPSPGRMLINIDISTGVMFREGSLIDVSLEFLRVQNPRMLAPKAGFNDRERLRLQRFLTGVRVTTPFSANPRPIKKLSSQGAADLRFSLHDGGTKTVAAYFREARNQTLKFPDVICVEVGAGALIPLELCSIPAGQIMRRQVPPEQTKEVLEFATRKPQDRLESIKRGLQVLSYGQSEFLRGFGMSVDSSKGPLSINARVLPAPVLRYGAGSKQPTVQPRDGAWNMIDKRFYQPASIPNGWMVVIFERQQRFNDQAAADMVNGLGRSCQDVGIRGLTPNPLVKWANGQGNVIMSLRQAGQEFNKAKGKFPSLIVAVLPEAGTDIYTAIKHFGDIQTGVATQCLKSSKCYRAKPQYYANVCLKINVKLGGINVVPDARSVPFLSDANQPTIVMGADVIHPAPGSDGRPSFTSLVANVDSETSKYVAATRVQTSRQEMIDDLEPMAFNLLSKWSGYRQLVEKKSGTPRRIIFYRDGVSEGQFKAVLEEEVPRLKAACKRANISPLPKITVIVVGKRHHVRFFPSAQGQADRSGNAKAGTVVDTDVTNPVEFDFYLQSHAGLLGTSRPAHYNVLLDENNFEADNLQTLSYALCHVYARSTRSVSIPAPVYYADIVCSRAKHHYDPNANDLNFSDDASQLSGGAAATSLDKFREQFKPLHKETERLMYFS